jgi:outer membrane protein assembly factor BamB
MKRILLSLACAAIIASNVKSEDWPQWLGPKRDANWTETGLVEKFPEGGPKILWRTTIAGGYAGPSVADGKVYVTDFKTGVTAENNPATRGKLAGVERVHCLDVKTGAPIWNFEYPCIYNISYPAGPRCTPTIAGGKVYTLGAEGNLVCLNAATGEKIWAKDFKSDYGAKTPMWGFCGHPLVDGKKLICITGGPNALAMAFDKDTGKELWHNLDAPEPGYSAPVIIEAGGKRQLLIWSSKDINGLDPETGSKYWSEALEPNYGMSIMVPQKAGDYLFAAGIQNKSLLLKLDKNKPAVTEVYRGKKDQSVYPVNMTPYIDTGIIYGVDQPGKLTAVKLETGERLWQTSVPITGKEEERPVGSGTAFVVKNGDRYFLFSESGHLIIAKLSDKGYEEISRAKVIEPTNSAFGRSVVWSHPAFANKCAFIRNDKELICVSLTK